MRKSLHLIYIMIIAILVLGACAPLMATPSSTPATATSSGAANQVTAIPTQKATLAAANRPEGTPSGSKSPTSTPSGSGSGKPSAGAPPSGGSGGKPSAGALPSGGSGGNSPGNGSGSSGLESGLATASGAYTLNSGSQTQSNQTYTATKNDQSGVYVIKGAKLTLNNVTVNTSGNTSSNENSSFYGLNAGVLATTHSSVTMNGGTITTTGSGANGAFAAGSGASVILKDVTINASGGGGHGVMATLGGSVTLTNVDMNTSGAHAAPIATDRGGGTINSTGGTLTTSGAGSPCYYSTGVLNITNSICKALGSGVAVVEGANSIVVTNSTLTSSVANSHGVMIYQSFSGDAQGSDGVFTVTGGSLSYTDPKGPLFYVTNTNGHITLKGVNASAASGILLKASGNERWGTQGSNGGSADFKADAQTLAGNFVVDNISNLTLSLQNGSKLTGAINAENSAKTARLTLDSSSTWSLSADSYLTCLSSATISGTSITNITGNGHNVYYNSSACSALGGKTYTLNGGGSLAPAK